MRPGLAGPQRFVVHSLLPWSPENEQVCLLPTLAEHTCSFVSA
jgi:hypothetical protein